jgi:hypothetical protein
LRRVFQAKALATMALAVGLPACGACIRALYESDVRFEHCMALDAAPEVKPTIQRACWEEWMSFYTFGQTRDRIDYARERRKELGVASDFDEADPPPRRGTAGVAPDPTSAYAPPPSTMASADGGAPDSGSPAVAENTADRDRCAAACDQRRESCSVTCKKTPACEQACDGHRKRCAARCDMRAQGSR